MDSNEKAIARTLAYSDIFDYPLKEEEIWKYLISKEKVDRDEFENKVKKINTIVYRNNGHLFLKGKKSSVGKRLEKQSTSVFKLAIARKTIEKLFLIPTVLFIGISGNLSMMNAKKEDDIDLFVITKKKGVWITRLMLIIYLKFLGRHRKRTEKNVSNKFCLNMLIDEERLSFPDKFRNIYTAHEIVQLMPIRERNNVYEAFLNSNKWIEDFMPNSISEIRKNRIVRSKKRSILKILFNIPLDFPPFEIGAKVLQGLLIKRNLTREVIEDGWIALHPRDYQGEIVSAYLQNLSRYGI